MILFTETLPHAGSTGFAHSPLRAPPARHGGKTLGRRRRPEKSFRSEERPWPREFPTMAAGSRFPAVLPDGVPAPVDDSAADHVAGRPCLEHGPPWEFGARRWILSAGPGLVAVFAFPRAGRPGEAPLVPKLRRDSGCQGLDSFQSLRLPRPRARASRRSSYNMLRLSAQDSGSEQEISRPF